MNSYLDIHKLYVSGRHIHTCTGGRQILKKYLVIVPNYLLPMAFLGENMIDHKAFLKLYNYTL